jgi:2-methylcitrate dehydratase
MGSLNYNARPPFDTLLATIADYAHSYNSSSAEALDTARYSLMDALGCAMLALHELECQRHLGPVVPGAVLPNGARVPGTAYELDPVQAAYNIGVQIRWLDYNDTWLAAEWGHPSDNLGAILACADYSSRQSMNRGIAPLTMYDVLNAMIKAYEIQGVLALKNSFNRSGIDHVILVKVASTAVATALLGGFQQTIINALSNAWIDGGSLRTYRHAPNTGWRKSWAAGDATARAVRHALLAIKGEMGYPSALSAPQWGFQDAMFGGKPIELAQPLGCYVMEHILFKVSYPVEFHAQTAVECAIQLHNRIKPRLSAIEHIELTTQEAALRIINKTGPLHNHADRDHSLQYAVAIGLLFGDLESRHYSDEVATDPRIDHLRSKMMVSENSDYSRDYLDPQKRSIANGVTIYFKDGSVEKAAIEYPIGHRRRRDVAKPLLIEKFETNLNTVFTQARSETLLKLMLEPSQLVAMPVDQFMGLWVKD